MTPNIQIHYAHINDSTPARCNRKTGDIYLNVNRWYDIEPQHWVYIILHEIGHIVLNTSDELAVDEWAQKQYIAHGYPLTESVKAITQILKGTNQEQINRGLRALDFAQKIDKTMNFDNSNTGSLNSSIQLARDSEDSFLGLGKAAKQRRAERHAMKMERKASKNELRLARADYKRDKGYSRSRLADQGISESSLRKDNTFNAVKDNLGSVASLAGAATGVSGIGSAIGGLFGGGGSTETEDVKTFTTENDYAPATTPKKWYQTTGAMVGIVITAIALVGTTIFLIKKYK